MYLGMKHSYTLQHRRKLENIMPRSQIYKTSCCIVSLHEILYIECASQIMLSGVGERTDLIYGIPLEMIK